MPLPDLLTLALIGFIGLLCQWLAWRVKLPAILFLLLSGMLLGPVSGILQPDELFGDLLIPFVSLAVAVILFEGALTLHRSEFAEVELVVRRLVSYGALLNGVIIAVATHCLIGVDWALAALFGAIMVVTGPTVIVPMLRTVRPNAHLARTLRWEGILIDPLGALLAVLVYEFIVAIHTGAEVSHALLIFGQTIAAGVLLGVVGGYCFGLVLRHRMLPSYLHNFGAIAWVTSVFGFSNTLMHESGLLAVTIMGMWLANMPNVHTRDILSFKESLTLIFVSAVFIILPARLQLEDIVSLGWGAFGVLLVMQFVARPAKVFLSTLGTNFTRNERLLLAWIGPRGVVAAAIAAVFALKLEAMAVPDAQVLVPLAFTIIVGTVLVQSLTARAFARLLKVTEPDNKGYLIIGANPVARAIALALEDAGRPSVLCDTNWSHISAARMKGLKTYYGNPISDQAELRLDLTSLGGMLGLSDNYAVNTTAALRFREDFDIGRVFILPFDNGESGLGKQKASEFYVGRLLFDEAHNYSALLWLLDKAGGQVKSTLLSKNYTIDEWRADNEDDETVLLFAQDDKGSLRWASSDVDLQPEPGWRLYYIAPPSPEKDRGGN